MEDNVVFHNEDMRPALLFGFFQALEMAQGAARGGILGQMDGGEPDGIMNT
jgi:hypothetical protein